MTYSNDVLLDLLSIGHNVSLRGEGISMKEALDRINYKVIRQKITTENLIPLIKEKPSIIEEWIMFSEDKRTNGGYSLDRAELNKINFEQIIKMTATYILKELDFWDRC